MVGVRTWVNVSSGRLEQVDMNDAHGPGVGEAFCATVLREASAVASKMGCVADTERARRVGALEGYEQLLTCEEKGIRGIHLVLCDGRRAASEHVATEYVVLAMYKDPRDDEGSRRFIDSFEPLEVLDLGTGRGDASK